MSYQEPPVPSKVANLASRGIQPRFNALAQSCRKLVLNHLAEHLNLVFLQIDDALFERAEKAENNAKQTHFFDAMREIRRLRPHIERRYQQQIAQHFADFLDGKAAAPETSSSFDAEQLSLVQTEEFEESLHITNMVTRTKDRCPQLLYGIEQRMALINSGQKLGDHNPFGPQLIAQSFRETLQGTSLPLTIRVILYQLFDREVMSSLEGLYAKLNQQLIAAGILPNLKMNLPRQSETVRPEKPEPVDAPAPEAPEAGNAQTAPQSTQRSGQAGAPLSTGTAAHSSASTGSGSSAGSPDSSAELDLSAPPPAASETLYQGLNHLLREHRQHNPSEQLPGQSRSISSFAPASAKQTYSADELLHALDRLQQQSAQEFAQRLRATQTVDDLKAALQQQLQSHSEQAHDSKVAEPQADVIDLVGMLFDFILKDENLPDTYKTALSHLHTPYLKIALLDKALFIQHQHPARRLLNAMAQAGILYDEGDDGQLLAKIHWVIERVIQDFAGELSLLDELLAEFNQYTDALKHRVELRERRAVEAAKGRDRLLGARDIALAEIKKCIENRQLPNVLHNFLELTWTDVLVFIWLRSGENSPEWKRACEVAEELAWSGERLDEAGQQKLQNIRVPMLTELRKGLELLGSYHEDGIRRLLQDLVACQHAVQANQPRLAEKIAPTLQASPLGTMLGEDAELAQPKVEINKLSARTRAISKELGELAFGTWFEFTIDGKPRILKLSWFSPTTHNYMFVDSQGQRAAMKPLAVLAQEIESGQVRIIAPEHSTPMVDRALNAIYRVLQRFTGRATNPFQGG